MDSIINKMTIFAVVMASDKQKDKEIHIPILRVDVMPLPIIKEIMKRYMQFALLFGIAMASRAQSYHYNTKFNISARHFVDSIPISFENNQIYISACSESQNLRFCLDTGSSKGIVYTNSKMACPNKLGKITSHDANGRIKKTDVVEFPPFSIGDITFTGYAGSLLDTNIPHKGYDAVIGFDIFNKGLSAKIDARNGVMVITDDHNYFSNEEGHVIKYKLERWVPYISVSPYAEYEDKARFDTGSRRLYVMSDDCRNRLSSQDPLFNSQIEGLAFGSRAIGSFGAEQADEVAFLHLDNLKWSDFSFKNYHTMTTQGMSRIGGEIFNYGSIIINPKRKTLTFQPYEDPAEVTVANKQMNIAFVPQDGKAKVGLIWEGSPHYKNGFRQGDTILSIDGKKVNTFQEFVSFPFIKDYIHVFTVLGKDGYVRDIHSER